MTAMAKQMLLYSEMEPGIYREAPPVLQQFHSAHQLIYLCRMLLFADSLSNKNGK
jgi:hypothetical protein